VIRFLRVLIAAPLLLAACGTGGGPITQPTSAPPSSSATARPTASPTPTPSAVSSAAPTSAACATTLTGKGTVPQAQIVDVRVGTHADYDRIVFEFVGRGGAAGVPDYEIKLAPRPIYKDPSGLPLTIGGDPVFGITLRGGTRQGLDGTAGYNGATVFKTGYKTLTELAEGGDFEAIATWYAGLSGASCVSAQVLADPARLVIDLTRR
jgi:hypothetical protein